MTQNTTHIEVGKKTTSGETLQEAIDGLRKDINRMGSSNSAASTVSNRDVINNEGNDLLRQNNRLLAELVQSQRENNIQKNTYSGSASYDNTVNSKDPRIAKLESELAELRSRNNSAAVINEISELKNAIREEKHPYTSEFMGKSEDLFKKMLPSMFGIDPNIANALGITSGLWKLKERLFAGSGERKDQSNDNTNNIGGSGFGLGVTQQSNDGKKNVLGTSSDDINEYQTRVLNLLEDISTNVAELVGGNGRRNKSSSFGFDEEEEVDGTTEKSKGLLGKAWDGLTNVIKHPIKSIGKLLKGGFKSVLNGLNFGLKHAAGIAATAYAGYQAVNAYNKIKEGETAEGLKSGIKAGLTGVGAAIGGTLFGAKGAELGGAAGAVVAEGADKIGSIIGDKISDLFIEKKSGSQRMAEAQEKVNNSPIGRRAALAKKYGWNAPEDKFILAELWRNKGDKAMEGWSDEQIQNYVDTYKAAGLDQKFKNNNNNTTIGESSPGTTESSEIVGSTSLSDGNDPSLDTGDLKTHSLHGISTVAMKDLGLAGTISSINSKPYISDKNINNLKILDSSLASWGYDTIYTSAMGGSHAGGPRSHYAGQKVDLQLMKDGKPTRMTQGQEQALISAGFARNGTGALGWEPVAGQVMGGHYDYSIGGGDKGSVSAQGGSDETQGGVASSGGSTGDFGDTTGATVAPVEQSYNTDSVPSTSSVDTSAKMESDTSGMIDEGSEKSGWDKLTGFFKELVGTQKESVELQKKQLSTSQEQLEKKDGGNTVVNNSSNNEGARPKVSSNMTSNK